MVRNTHPNHEEVDDIQRRAPSGKTLRNRDGIVCKIVRSLRGVGSLVKDVAHKGARGVACTTVAWCETDDYGNDVNVFRVALSTRVSRTCITTTRTLTPIPTCTVMLLPAVRVAPEVGNIS